MLSLFIKEQNFFHCTFNFISFNFKTSSSIYKIFYTFRNLFILYFHSLLIRTKFLVETSTNKLNITTQVRIAEGDNTAQYRPNLGSQQSAIFIGPVSPFASVKCQTIDSGLCRLFKFTDLQPKLGPASALYQTDCHFNYEIQFRNRRSRVQPMDGRLLGHVSLLPRQTILEVRKPEFGTALARCCAENKCWQPEFRPELATKCVPELSFQQRHDIANRSSAIFLPMLGQCWAVSHFPLGYNTAL